MDLRGYIDFARTNAMILVVGALVGSGTAAGVTLAATPQYQSTSRAFISTQLAGSVTDLSQGNAFAQDAVASYAQVARSPIVLQPVIQKLGLHTTPAKLASRLTATGVQSTAILEVTCVDANPRTAAAVANEVTSRLGTVVEQLSPHAAATGAPIKLTQIETAVPSVAPVSPNLRINLAAGALAGILMALLTAALRATLDTRLMSAAAVEEHLRAPLLGMTPFERDFPAHILPAAMDVDSYAKEAYKTIRTNLQFLRATAESRAFVVTSSVPGEGKSVTCANLGIALSETTSSVVIVDGDLRRPTVASYLGLDGSVGLTDVLIGDAQVNDALQSWGEQGLRVLPAGRLPPNPAELLQSDTMVDVLEALTTRFDVVLIDAPPILAVADASILAKRTSGVLMVCAVERTRRQQLQAAAAHLRQLDVTIHGGIITMAPSRTLKQEGYGSLDYYARDARP